MKYLLFICLCLTAVMSFSVNAEIEPMFSFEVREDRSTAQENTGKEYPLFPSEFRRIAYVGTYNTDTKAIVIEKSFVVAGGDVPVDPVEPTPTEPPIDLPPIVVIDPFEGTTKGQVLGLITQLENLIAADTDTAKAMRSVADLYGKTDEVKTELNAMREIINGIE